MELTDIPGIGPTKAKRLQEAGIQTVEQLATLDLRKPVDVNIGTDVLKRAKQEARRSLRAEGISFEKAAYGGAVVPAPVKGKNTAAKNTAAKNTAVNTTPAKKERSGDAAIVSFANKEKVASDEKPGFLARIFRRN